MIEFDVDMGYLLECDELDKVVLNDEDGEYEPMEFILKDAATVGAGTLTAEQVRECSKGVYFEGYSDGATHRVNGIEETDWQAIADKLNAVAGTGTCELINAADDLGEGTSSCMCSKCGYTALDDCWDEFKYCPNCGRRIEEVAE